MNRNEKREVELSDLSAIMSTDAGRNVLLRILEHSGYFTSSYSQDQREHAFNEGRREEGLWLIQEMKQADSRHLMNILKEHYNE